MTATVDAVGATAPAAPAPRVLALDLSLTATGVAAPDGTLETIRPQTMGDRRLVEIRTAVRTHLNVGAPTLAALEGYVIRSGAASALGMLHGVIRALLIERGVPYLLVPPATLKVYATGSGQATKADMRMALYQRCGIDDPDDNRVDAAWLRLLALDLAGHQEVALPKTHRRALQKLALPTP